MQYSPNNNIVTVVNLKIWKAKISQRIFYNITTTKYKIQIKLQKLQKNNNTNYSNKS